MRARLAYLWHSGWVCISSYQFSIFLPQRLNNRIAQHSVDGDQLGQVGCPEWYVGLGIDVGSVCLLV